MGGQPSKPLHQLSQHEKAAIDRVRELRIDEDYIEVSSEKQPRGGMQFESRAPQGLNPISLNAFIRQVLDDPKNRWAIIVVVVTFARDSNTGQTCSYGSELSESPPGVAFLAYCTDRSTDLQP